jgi:hypothetical protein
LYPGASGDVPQHRRPAVPQGLSPFPDAVPPSTEDGDSVISGDDPPHPLAIITSAVTIKVFMI